MVGRRSRDWSEQLAREGRVEIGLRTGRLSLLLLTCTAFVVVGLLMGLNGEDTADRVMGWVAVAFFGLGLVIFPAQLARRGPAVVVDGQGIAIPSQDLLVPWTAAVRASVFSAYGTEVVQVAARPEFLDRFYEEHRALAAVRGANQSLTGEDSLSLPSPLAARADDLAAWLTREIERRNRS